LALHIKGAVLSVLGRYDDAIKCFDKAIDLVSPGNRTAISGGIGAGLTVLVWSEAE